MFPLLVGLDSVKTHEDATNLEGFRIHDYKDSPKMQKEKGSDA